MYLSALEANSAQKFAKKHILGNLILPNISYFGTSKQAAARPNISALGGVPGDFLALSNPYRYI